MKEYKIQTTKQAAFIIAKSLSIAVVCVLILVFMANKISGNAKEMTNKRSDFTASVAKYDLLSQLKSDSTRVNEDMVKLKAIAPSLDDAPVITGYIDTAARQTSSIISVRFDPKPQFDPSGEFVILNFSIDNTGNMATLTDFLKKMENSPYIININNVSLGFAGSVEGQVQAKILGTVHLKQK